MKTVKAIARAVIVGALGGAISGALIVCIPDHSYSPVALVAAVFGSLFGIIAFPVCYLTLVRDVPMWLIVVCAVPATVAGEIALLLYTSNFTTPVDYFWFGIFGGGFGGLLLTCVDLRIIYSSKRIGVAN